MEYNTEISGESQAQVDAFWELAKIEAEKMKIDQNSFKAQDLPLARIKKIMKLDDEVKTMMISAEAPTLFAKAAELFIRELTLRAWIHTERNRRRTLQRNDISMAVSYGDTDQFDFLIDIVPRDEGRGHRRSQHSQPSMQHMSGPSGIQQTNEEHQTIKAESLLSINTGSSEAMSGGDLTMIPTAVSIGSSTSLGMLQQQPTIQFATIPSGATTIQALSTSTPSTISGTTGIQHASTGHIQYVFQLPGGNASTNQPFQIQMLPQHFQTASTDAVATQSGTSGLQVVQVLNPQSGITLANASTPQDVGNRIQTVQLPDLTSGSTHLVQPSGLTVVTSNSADSVFTTSCEQTLVSVGALSQHLAYTSSTGVHSIQIFTDITESDKTQNASSHQIILNNSDATGCDVIAELSSINPISTTIYDPSKLEYSEVKSTSSETTLFETMNSTQPQQLLNSSLEDCEYADSNVIKQLIEFSDVPETNNTVIIQGCSSSD